MGLRRSWEELRLSRISASEKLTQQSSHSPTCASLMPEAGMRPILALRQRFADARKRTAKSDWVWDLAEWLLPGAEVVIVDAVQPPMDRPRSSI